MVRQHGSIEQSPSGAAATAHALRVSRGTPTPAGTEPLWDDDGGRWPVAPPGQGAAAAQRPTGLSDAEVNALVRRWTPALLSYLHHLCGALQDAEDLLQETFLKAWEHGGAMRDPAAARSWLFSVAGNLYRRQLRAGPRLRSGPALPLREDLEAGPEAPPWSDTLLQALAALSADERQILLLTSRHGFTLPEAAALVGCSAAAGGKRWQRGCSHLAANLRQLTSDTSGDDRQAGSAGRKDGRR
ncbi:MAG TPA: RNA polymerase sigma factor [Anaerolineae bacterium]|nr:RNA polymerase sigma factor [Anaerolineae bacterium]